MWSRARASIAALTLLAVLAGPAATVPVASAQVQGFFEIFFRDIDAGVQYGLYRFQAPPWEFGDRPGYRCAWGFLVANGQRVARVQFDRGQGWVQVNDRYGAETENDFSQCIPETAREVKPKPAGLGDTTVGFVLGGSELASLTFPETSPEDADSWWEVQEVATGRIEMELYWRDEVVVVATLTSLDPALVLAVSSSSPPQIASFAPTGGKAGETVSIVGANFVGVTSVTFGGVAATFQVASAGEVVATVPSGATTGPIAVTTALGTATSATDFTIASGITHRSDVSLALKGRLVATGRVDATDGTAACRVGRSVIVERLDSGSWKTVGRDRTGSAGKYRERVADVSGTYRARVKRTILDNGDVCRGDVSAKRSS
jgi:hypothetical protein